MQDAMKGHFEYSIHPQYGPQITKINGEGGTIDGKDYYWALYVDGKYSEYGIGNFNITEEANHLLWQIEEIKKQAH